ncbi:MAG TPA: mechanosensitive ion channel domain-containing protein [Nocardioides sp.]|uniref:mechanosensitive ion channel family protein n=1 Tax=Nocardioides sp. TaxID=35761 RepID=UPI002F3F19B9
MPEPLTLISQEQWQHVGKVIAAKSGTLAALIVIGLLIQFVLHRLIDKLVSKAEQGVLPDRITHAAFGRGAAAEPSPGSTRRVQRAKTLGTLLKSISSGVIVAVIVTMMLSAVGLNIGPIIASAGIAGVALGFGSQTLVKDFLSGIFLIFEDQYGVGDVVDMGEGLSGTVEAVSLRVTRMRDTNGTVWYVRNGELYRVGNMSQNWARTVLDVQVSAREDLPRVRGVLTDVIHDLWQDDDYDGIIIEEPEIWGIEAMTPDAITLRVALKTAPMEQWRVARVLRARIKSRFDHEGIQAPFPTSYVMNRTPGAQEPAATPVGADADDT